jgi:TolB protein
MRRVLIIASLLLCGACEKDAPTRPVLPAAGDGFIFSSVRDIPLASEEIYTMRSDGSGLVRLTNDSLDDREPRWSPDGKRIAYIHGYTTGGYRPNVTVMDADGANPVRFTFDEGDVNPCWSPEGSRIAFERDLSLFSRNQLWIVNADGTSPALIVDSLEVSEISWTPQNTFLGIDFFGIAKFNVDGTGRTRILDLTPGTVYGAYPRMSPDGSRIVFQWGGQYSNDPQIYVMNSDGTNLQPLTNSSGGKAHPVWSRDGTKIAFTGSQDQPDFIWVMDIDGSNLARVSPSPGGDYLGDWR